MTIHSKITGQFKQPHGLLGHVAGFIMASRGSNRARNLWTVDLLDLDPSHHVLELGCGPGLSLKACASKLMTGCAIGVDHSKVMITQAQKRLSEEIQANKVALYHGSFDRIESLDIQFDRIFSVNVIQFLPDMNVFFTCVYNHLTEGGMCATTYQPRHKNPKRNDALRMAENVTKSMKDVGFKVLRTEELFLKPVPAISVIGQRRHS